MLQFFEKKGVPDVKSPEDLFKSITGFDEVDVNMLEGVHTTYNSLANRFEVALDDNRNVSYPFEYCWQKTNEVKQAKSDKSADECDDDEFEEMWTHSIKNKDVDTATNFANELKIEEPVEIKSEEKPIKAQNEELVKIIDDKVNFGNVLNVDIPIDHGICSKSIDKKS